MRSGACACRSGPRPGLFPADQVGLTGPRHFLAPGPSLRVPSDTGCGRRASVEGGQRDSPLRPAAGVGSTRAHRGILCRNRCAAASARATARLLARCKRGFLRKPSVGYPGSLAISLSSPVRRFEDPRWRPRLRGTPTRRRADRRFVLAIFPAREDAASSVRRDAQRWSRTAFVPRTP